ncbi:MAG: hypothetical protein AB1499_13630, partial [Nitrospirota bacterium]
QTGKMNELRTSFDKAVRTSALIAAGMLVCAALVEWLRTGYAPAAVTLNTDWTRGVKNFLYLMAMFNILISRYAVMRIYAAPGHIDIGTVSRRLYRASAVSMLFSGLPVIYGVVLFLICGDPVDFYLLFGLSVLYAVISLPRLKNWVMIAEENIVSRQSDTDL